MPLPFKMKLPILRKIFWSSDGVCWVESTGELTVGCAMTGASLLLKDQKASNRLSAVFLFCKSDYRSVVPKHHTRSVFSLSKFIGLMFRKRWGVSKWLSSDSSSSPEGCYFCRKSTFSLADRFQGLDITLKIGGVLESWMNCEPRRLQRSEICDSYDKTK